MNIKAKGNANEVLIVTICVVGLVILIWFELGMLPILSTILTAFIVGISLYAILSAYNIRLYEKNNKLKYRNMFGIITSCNISEIYRITILRNKKDSIEYFIKIYDIGNKELMTMRDVGGVIVYHPTFAQFIEKNKIENNLNEFIIKE